VQIRLIEDRSKPEKFEYKFMPYRTLFLTGGNLAEDEDKLYFQDGTERPIPRHGTKTGKTYAMERFHKLSHGLCVKSGL
jgi:hypothetical protein